MVDEYNETSNNEKQSLVFREFLCAPPIKMYSLSPLNANCSQFEGSTACAHNVCVIAYPSTF